MSDTVTVTVLVDCPKCWGLKNFRCWSHVAGGDCFTCGGTGTLSITRARAEFIRARKAALQGRSAERVAQDAQEAIERFRYFYRELRTALAMPGETNQKFNFLVQARHNATATLASKQWTQDLSYEQMSKIKAGFLALDPELFTK